MYLFEKKSKSLEILETRIYENIRKHTNILFELHRAKGSENNVRT